MNSVRSASVLRMNENCKRIGICLSKLNEEEVWRRPNPASNTIGNLIIHLSGNISQYILSALGGEEDRRQRSREFSDASGTDSGILLEGHGRIVGRAVEIIGEISEEDALKLRIVQGFSMDGISIIMHVVEHYSYHTGQIAYATKLMKSADLGFYKGIDLEKKNKKA